MFRAMAVYPDLKPYTGMFDVEMKVQYSMQHFF